MGNSAGKNVVDEKIMDKLKSFDGTGESFKRINKELTDGDKKRLSKYFEIWKIGCLYKLILKTNNDLGFVASEIISQFEELEPSVLHGTDIHAKMSLYYATRDNKYLPSEQVRIEMQV